MPKWYFSHFFRSESVYSLTSALPQKNLQQSQKLYNTHFSSIKELCGKNEENEAMKKILFATMLLWSVAACQSRQTSTNTLARVDSTSETESRSRELEVSVRPKKSIEFTYFFVEPKKWLEEHGADSAHQRVAFAVNRTDRQNFLRMDSVLVPTDLEQDVK